MWESMRELFSAIIRQEEIPEIIRWIWKPCSMTSFMERDIPTGESGESPYLRTRMRMGIYDTTLDSIQVVSETDHTYYIQGTNFTPSSQVKINGEWYDTVYVNPTKLIITGKELDDFDRLSVVQRSNSSTRKAMTKSHDRAVYALLADSKWKLDSEKSSSDTGSMEETDTALETESTEDSGEENSTDNQ